MSISNTCLAADQEDSSNKKEISIHSIDNGGEGGEGTGSKIKKLQRKIQQRILKLFKS